MLSEARRRNNKNYQQKTKTVLVTFSAKEINNYELIKEHCKSINMTIQKYFIMLAKEDMKNWK